ncbi:CehA/McbA family metallohydrolase [Butyrivibrio sp. MC2021]|uniref:CehA/McbA family metallohydrolase n=1 Tax=Butyrivibrio sp. MC2021 TaxID=1408306 RepID=UPI00047ECB33|nr:CehA/McbA family metallohydrolase [Butyrivibrio sp. MC2021]
MSKETKFLSIAIGLMQGIQKERGISDPVLENMTADRLDNFIRCARVVCPSAPRRTNEVDYPAKNFRNRFHRNGIPEGCKALGDVFVETTRHGRGIPAQVKFFKLLENETPEEFDRVNGKITMIRDITGLDGVLHRFLPVGRYVVEVSRGSEYEIIEDYIEVEKGGLVKKNYELNRFINLDKMGFIAGDIHHHSIYSSPTFGGDDDVVEAPSEVANSMMAMGLGFGALSDHHNILCHKAWKAGERYDFIPIISKEISTSNGHVIALGVDTDVIYKIPEPEDRTDEYLRSEFVRITDEIKEKGGLAQINHPRDLQKAISWNPDFNDMLDIFETMEIWNGSNPMMSGSTNDLARTLWHQCMRKGLFLPATTGSDTHNICADDYHVLYDEIMDLRTMTQLNTKELSEKYPEEVQVFSQIFENLLPILEKWAETNLTSGGVRTYVNLGTNKPREETHTAQNVMDALRAGHSFLTNGPILMTTVNGKGPGEKLSKGANALEIDIKLYANRPLSCLQICTENGVVKELELKAAPENGFYDYSMELTENIDDYSDSNYIYFLAKDDCTNLAITNPVIR